MRAGKKSYGDIEMRTDDPHGLIALARGIGFALILIITVAVIVTLNTWSAQ